MLLLYGLIVYVALLYLLYFDSIGFPVGFTCACFGFYWYLVDFACDYCLLCVYVWLFYLSCLFDFVDFELHFNSIVETFYFKL